VWAATALFGLVTALWTVAVPAFRAPDEAAHLDLVLYLAEGHGYPAFDGRVFGEAVGLDTDRHLVELSRPWPRFAAGDALPRASRPDVEDLGGTAPDDDARRNDPDRAGAPYVYNQMPQHPPLYYLGMATVLRLERLLLPGDGLPSLDRELGLLRLVDVGLVTPLPLLAWATVARLGGDDRAGTVAALLPLGLPQLTHIGGALNNDDLFTPLGALLAVLLAGVGRGRRSRRTDLAVGLVLGLALLTKAFAVMFVPWVAAAYLLGALSARRADGPASARPVHRWWRPWLGGALVAGGTAVAVGGWWWLANWARYGEPAPTTETLTRTAAQRPPGVTPDPAGFLLAFPARLLDRTWAWVGVGTPKVELPPAVVALLAAAVVVTTVAALLAGRRGLAVTRPAAPRRWDLALAWLPTLLVTAFVLRRALGLHETTGKVAFVQGRYLFGAIVAAIAVVALGASRLLGRAAPAATFAVVAALQAATLARVLDASWTGPAPFGPVRGMLAWAPWPPAAVLGVALAAVAVTGGLARHAARELRPRRP
jgi:small subunit ribosomal protein S36